MVLFFPCGLWFRRDAGNDWHFARVNYSESAKVLDGFLVWSKWVVRLTINLRCCRFSLANHVPQLVPRAFALCRNTTNGSPRFVKPELVTPRRLVLVISVFIVPRL